MDRYLNTSAGPFRYNDDGQTADGFAWFESEETPQIKAAFRRRELVKVDSGGNFIYDSIEEPENNETDGFDGPLIPEKASTKNSKKDSEG